MTRVLILSTAAMLLVNCIAATQPTENVNNKMSSVRMAEVIQRFDEDAKVATNNIAFKLREREHYLMFDVKADRMRVMTPIIQSVAVPEALYERLMQANFDAVLDSRYAISNDLIWAVFIHKLSTLTEDDLRSGIAQTYTAAETFGSTYTSGAIVYGGGDSNSIHEKILEELENLPDKDSQGI